MIIVADSSPLVAFVGIDHLPILPLLFGSIFIPPQVLAELVSPRRPASVRRLAANPPAWLQLRAPQHNPAIHSLHAGEAAAMNLAVELNAQLLLMDEKEGRTVALSRGLAVTGTVGILERAAEEHALDLRQAFERLLRTDFWISPALLATRMQLFEERQIQARARAQERGH